MPWDGQTNFNCKDLGAGANRVVALAGPLAAAKYLATHKLGDNARFAEGTIAELADSISQWNSGNLDVKLSLTVEQPPNAHEVDLRFFESDLCQLRTMDKRTVDKREIEQAASAAIAFLNDRALWNAMKCLAKNLINQEPDPVERREMGRRYLNGVIDDALCLKPRSDNSFGADAPGTE